MKKILFIVVAIGGIVLIKSQQPQIVVNDRLLFQLQKNQLVRVGSEKNFFKSYEKQKKIYEDSRKKIAQVVAVQEYIYQQLKNVNSAFRHGKMVQQIWEEFDEVMKNSKQIIEYNALYPQYSVFLTKAYEEIWIRLIRIKNYLEKEALNENNNFLMDSYDREKILVHVGDELRALRAGTYGIIMFFQRARTIPYLLHSREIRNYINIDKQIIQEMIHKIKYFKY
ncbi:hypothetical protein [Bergeyella sp. RCAD1439]|uniref:hypothetical protein n=1 Tax=Bergeyella anatis TaxID=3113737 RepID=UPI002E197614|nr:hypothetical protein [Bergeyella sp. RCAD1439]